jgi:hypothetical protein
MRCADLDATSKMQGEDRAIANMSYDTATRSAFAKVDPLLGVCHHGEYVLASILRYPQLLGGPDEVVYASITSRLVMSYP